MAPNVGLNPKIPLNDAGRMMLRRLCRYLTAQKMERYYYLPIVCVPRAIGTWKSPTAAPDPEEEPPGVRAELCGFLVFVPTVIEANSVVVVFPEDEVRIEIASKLRRTEYQCTSTP